MGKRTWAGQQGLAAHGPEMLTCDRAAQIASTVLDLMAAPAAHQADCPTTLQVWMNGAFTQTIAHIRASATTQTD